MKRRNRIATQWSPRLIEMLESPAYRAMTLSAHRVISRIEIELANHGGTDNGRLPVTFDDFVTYGIHRHAIAPAIREASALGFIEVTEQGRAGNAEWRKPNLFRLTFRGKDVGDGTHEWRQIKEEDASRIAAVARKMKPGKLGRRWRKTPIISDEDRHRNGKIHSAENTATAQSANTATTLDISGGGKE